MKTLTPPGAASRSGTALVLALIVVTIVAALGAALLSLNSASAKRVSAELDNLQAFYLAEAGLAEAFQAVRIGRTGQIGSEAAPALHGNGLLWVDAIETGDDQVRLESTALVGGGRATLAYVVEPVEIPLGFFSQEDLVIESVLLVDGYDSTAGSYTDQLARQSVELDPDDPFSFTDVENELFYQHGTFFRTFAQEDGRVYYDHSASSATTSQIDDRYSEGVGWPELEVYTDAFTGPEYDRVLAYFASVPVPEPVRSGDLSASPEATTGQGGLFGSDGGITFLATDEGPSEIYGDLLTGADRSVTGLEHAVVTGDIGERALAVQLPSVIVPTVELAAPLRHDGLLPYLVSSGTSGYESIVVGDGAELCLKGPATVVLGSLTLEPGALLTFDTRDGDVEVFVTVGMDLQAGSEVTTTSQQPGESSVQVAGIASDPVGGAPIKLDATSQFYGKLYAPDTEVHLGSEFEVYGQVVARKLDIGPGARLHFDQADMEDSPIPRLVSWKLVELPSAVKGRRGDPFETLGLERADLLPLSEAHELAEVQLELKFLNLRGIESSYSGPEDEFDWKKVLEVVSIARNAERVKEPASDARAPAVDRPTGMRPAFQSALDGYVTSGFALPDLTVLALTRPLLPLSAEEWTELEGYGAAVPTTFLELLRTQDIEAGGTGGR